jgi:V8-like Glu-specific endopeptidase
MVFMKLLALLFTLSITAQAFAIPTAPFDALVTKVARPNVDGFDFEGIVKLSNCSGSLIRFSGQPDSAKAVVLTNGHCLGGMFGGMPKPGEVLVNKLVSRSMKIFDKEMKTFPITTTRILFAAMTDTDITLYELSQTYAEILSKYKIRSFDLDTVRPMVGTDIDIVSGYWERGYACNIENFVYRLQEGDWTFNDSIRYAAGCETIGGTSGSPIIARGTRTVIAVNNTANENGGRCTVNNPCEINTNGAVVVMRDRKYGQQTYNLYSCLRPDFRIDLAIPGCVLPKAKK